LEPSAAPGVNPRRAHPRRAHPRRAHTAPHAHRDRAARTPRANCMARVPN